MSFAHVNGGGAGLGEAGHRLWKSVNADFIEQSKGVFGTQRGFVSFRVYRLSEHWPRIVSQADPCAAPVVGHSLHY